MDLLQFLLSFLFGDKNSPDSAQKDEGGEFNFGEILKSFDLEKIFPFLGDLFSPKKETRPTESAKRAHGLEPICLIANKDIIYSLNLYFSKHFLT